MPYRQIRERAVTRPSVTPLRSSILDHATVVEDADHFDLMNEAGLWPSYNCLDTLVPTALCPDPTEDKVFDVVPWTPAFSFAVHAGVECNFVGLNVEEQKSEIKRVFNANEGRGVERALKSNRFVERVLNGDLGPHRRVEWDGPTVLMGGTPMTPKAALAILEGYARSIYTGQPTLHLPAALVSYLGSDKFVWENGLAYTRLGSKVAMGGGYDEDYSQGWDGTWDLFATGEVYVEKGPEIHIQTHELNGAAGARFDSNTSVALVERPFRAAVDCFVATITASIEDGSGGDGGFGN